MIPLQITQAGLTAAVDAQNNSIALQLTHIAVGDAGYTPNGAELALQNELQRVAVASGAQDGNILHLVASLDGPSSFWVYELGVFDADGVMFGVWSSPDTPLAYKQANGELLLFADFGLDGVYDIVIPETTLPVAAGYYQESLDFSGSVQITHNLGSFPSITVLDSNGFEARLRVQHLDTNTVELTSNAPFTGLLYAITKEAAYSGALNGTLSQTVNHGLGRFPAVTVIDLQGFEFAVSVRHIDSNTLALASEEAMYGQILLN